MSSHCRKERFREQELLTVDQELSFFAVCVRSRVVPETLLFATPRLLARGPRDWLLQGHILSALQFETDKDAEEFIRKWKIVRAKIVHCSFKVTQVRRPVLVPKKR